MIKYLARIEHKIGERLFHFHCDNDAPIHEIKDALFHLSKIVGNIEDAQKQAASVVPPAFEPVKEESDGTRS